MAMKWKPNQINYNRKTGEKTVQVFPIAGVKTSTLVELCTKEDSTLRKGERKLRVKARKELKLRGVSV